MLNVLGCRLTHLGQAEHHREVQYSFTSTETRRLVRTDSPARSPRLSHSSWTMLSILLWHEWTAFYSAFLNIHGSCVLTALAWLVPHGTAAVSARSVYTTVQPQNKCHFMQSHIRKVCAFLAVTCHLHFWQNDWPGSFTCCCGSRLSSRHWLTTASIIRLKSRDSAHSDDTKLQALVYDILPSRKVPESDARSVWRHVTDSVVTRLASISYISEEDSAAPGVSY